MPGGSGTTERALPPQPHRARGQRLAARAGHPDDELRAAQAADPPGRRSSKKRRAP